jgi:uncharacterized protein YndB with AHSA1/START domain
VHIRSDRRYRFRVGRRELWTAISDVERYPGWWPWLRRFEANALALGDTWSCVVQPPLPYAVRFRISIDDLVEGERIGATLAGDIEGTARLHLVDIPTGCEARMTSALAPDHRALRAVALVARPLVRFGHDWVLDTGAAQFTASVLPAEEA